MNYRLILFSLSLIIFNAVFINAVENYTVKNAIELNDAIKNAKAGDEIVLSNGVWKDLAINFYGDGTEENPIVLRAEISGKVFLEGQSYLKLGGNYLVVKGLYFRNGYTPNRTVIDFKIDDERIAYNCRVTNCVIEEYVQPNRYDADHWVEFWGRHNQLDHCYIAGKFNQGPTIRVFLSGNEHIRNYHQITNNHFGPRPRKGGPKAETMQIGDSYTSMTPSYVKVANNYFEKCNGEVEIISSKSNFNEFRNNIFFESEGSLVMRHGNYCIIDGNFFIGNESSNFIGGIRVINTGHWITNNYFYKLKSDEFRSPLAIMNGIPKSPLNRYNQVTDVVVAYNSWIDCRSPWQFSVGANIDKTDVLPKSEIRSARPIRTIMANNLIYNLTADEVPIKSYDNVDGVLIKNNFIDNADGELNDDRLKQISLDVKKISDWLYIPSDNNNQLVNVYKGFEFENIKEDVFGNARTGINFAGAITGGVQNRTISFDKNSYGAEWYTPANDNSESKIITVSNNGNELREKIESAKSGDILELSQGTYRIESSLVVDKKITIKAKLNNDEINLIYSGNANTPLFEMNPRGNLTLKNIVLEGNNGQLAFAPLEKNMSLPYHLKIQDCRVKNFSYVLKSYRGSMADSISFDGVKVTNCENGIVLNSETDDKGDYNAEFVSIRNCEFENVQQDVIDFYRGGYDESTIGGNLVVENSVFRNCGKDEESNILLKTRGIINVNIINNTFENNPVKLIALLWGEKNNFHSGNKIVGEAIIRVDQFLKQKLVY